MPAEPPGWARGLPPELRLLRRVGHGAFGEVYEAEDHRRGRVAVKALTVQMDPKARRRFAREAEVLAGLDHPHILRIFQVGEAEGRPYLVLELLDGTSLEERVPDAAPLDVMLPIAGALAHAHGRGVIHRDVKSGNVVWTQEGRAVLVDFGLVTRPEATRLTATGAVVGSLGYLSPELLLGGTHDASSDMWAWAVTLYELCEHRLPFPLEALEAAMGGAPLPLPPFLRLGPADPERRILEGFFGRDPADRPADPAAIEDLRRAPAPLATGGWGSAAVARTGVTRAAPGPQAAAARPYGRWPLGLAAVAVVVASFLVSDPPPAAPPQLEAISPVSGTPGDRFGAGYVERVLAELDALPPCPDPVPEPWSPCRDRDPRRWPEVLAALPAVREFEAWVVGGGRPEELPDAVRRGLRAAGERFARRGLPEPFSPWDRVAPAPLEGPELAELVATLPGGGAGRALPATAGPWTGAALRAARELGLAQRRLLAGPFLDELRRAGGRPSDLLGGEERSPRQLIKAAYWDRLFRVRAAREMAPGIEALQVLVYAAARAIRDAEHGASRTAVIAQRLLHSSDLFWFGPSAFVGLPRVLGIRPETPPEAFLGLRVAQVAEDVVDAADARSLHQRWSIDLASTATTAARSDPRKGRWERKIHRSATAYLERLHGEGGGR